MQLTHRQIRALKNPRWPQEVSQIVEPISTSKIRLPRDIPNSSVANMLMCLMEIDLSRVADETIGALCSMAASRIRVAEEPYSPEIIEDVTLIPETLLHLLLLGYGLCIGFSSIVRLAIKQTALGHPDELIADFISHLHRVNYVHKDSILNAVFTSDNDTFGSVIRTYSSIPKHLRSSFVYALALGQKLDEAKQGLSRLTRTSFKTAIALNRQSFIELDIQEERKHKPWTIPFRFQEKPSGRQSWEQRIEKLRKAGKLIREVVGHPHARKYMFLLSNLAVHLLRGADYWIALGVAVRRLSLPVHSALGHIGEMSVQEINEAFARNDIIKLCQFADDPGRLTRWVVFLGSRPLNDHPSANLYDSELDAILEPKYFDIVRKKGRS